MAYNTNSYLQNLNKRSIKHKDNLRLKSNQFKYKTLFEKSCDELIDLNCFVCSNTDFQKIASFDRYGFDYPTGICRCCGNVQQMKYYTQEDLVNFYTNFYREIYDGRTPEELAYFQRTTSAPKIYNFLQLNGIKNGCSVLEVGCGAGGILDYLKSKGFEVLGTDFDEKHLAHAEEENIAVRHGGLEQVKPHERFDLIILNHVLEHIVDPVEFLKLVSQHLTSIGKLIIEVPTLESLKSGAYGSDFMAFLQNAHTCHYSEATLNAVCTKAGLRAFASSDENLKMFELVKCSEEMSFLNYRKLKTTQLDLVVGIEKQRTSFGVFLERVSNNFYFLIRSIIKKVGLLPILKKLLTK